MTQEEVEALLRTKYETGEISSGLFDAGIRYVVLDSVGDELTFTWFDTVESIHNLLDD